MEQNAEANAEEIQRKFRFDNRIVELNDERFVDFGNIDGANNATNDLSVTTTAWDEENGWDGIDQAELDQHANTRRHQKRVPKQSSRPKVPRSLGATKKEAID